MNAKARKGKARKRVKMKPSWEDVARAKVEAAVLWCLNWLKHVVPRFPAVRGKAATKPRARRKRPGKKKLAKKSGKKTA